ncbi:MAG: glutathione S-transferase family protein [Gammaproteobacteria bacterium]|nr:glutathione S-transferase family protein [Gammaproteobacteria bacterium]
MSNIILHHYPESPFSEKIRLLLGYKKQSYQAVTIPIIMPKPDLMPLTGGYRKTPVMQIGADIYCDTAIICRVIDRLCPDDTIYPTGSQATTTAATHWTDTFFFRVCVAVAFQPRALANNTFFQDQEAAASFMADRAKFTEGSTQLTMDFETAHPYFLGHLKRLDNQLESSEFLNGDMPTIIDFSTYHCCWFVHNIEAIRDSFSPFERVLAWFERMSAYGQGDLTELEGSAALEIAKNANPSSISKSGASEIDQMQVGDEVEVMPIDYGFQPVRGKLQLSSMEELVVGREEEQVGEVAVHFPRLGFRVTQLAQLR